MNGAPGWIRTGICRFRRSVPLRSSHWSLETTPYPTLPRVPAGLSHIAPSQGGDSIPPPARGRSTAFAPALRRGKCCRVGVRPLTRPFADHRGPRVDPHPARFALSDLPLSGGGFAELAAPLSPTALERMDEQHGNCLQPAALRRCPHGSERNRRPCAASNTARFARCPHRDFSLGNGRMTCLAVADAPPLFATLRSRSA